MIHMIGQVLFSIKNINNNKKKKKKKKKERSKMWAKILLKIL